MDTRRIGARCLLPPPDDRTWSRIKGPFMLTQRFLGLRPTSLLTLALTAGYYLCLGSSAEAITVGPGGGGNAGEGTPVSLAGSTPGSAPPQTQTSTSISTAPNATYSGSANGFSITLPDGNPSGAVNIPTGTSTLDYAAKDQISAIGLLAPFTLTISGTVGVSGTGFTWGVGVTGGIIQGGNLPIVPDTQVQYSSLSLSPGTIPDYSQTSTTPITGLINPTNNSYYDVYENVQLNFNNTSGQSMTVYLDPKFNITASPEPSTLVLGGICFASLPFYYWRRTKAAA